MAFIGRYIGQYAEIIPNLQNMKIPILAEKKEDGLKNLKKRKRKHLVN